ncbi:trans-resveratrol di-O-methyltransferase-like [Momordica charantia]|uniref:Trans-resveratrol di-O-methyltransferase-like n=1 Tax=Momordica charantia TaxID=3673 RepID=A0A6J1DHJ0_MOMCH|nr:trans-resveratrol di-O-methyltransferase-like [Momordica charantia]
MGDNIELLKAQAHVWNHAYRYMDSMSLKCAVELGIPDIIHSHGEPMSLSNLVGALHIQPFKAHCLGRLMSLLVHSGFFVQTHDENEQEVKYTLTSTSRLLLRHNTPFEHISLLLLIFNKAMMASYETMSSWFRSTDERHSCAFETTNDKSVWDYVAQEPDFSNILNKAMMYDSQLIGRVVTRECRRVFKGLKSLVDVGGNRGFMAKAIAEAFPHITCIVFDLPHVVDNLQQTTENLNFIAGNMFEAKIPPANAVLLKWVLHDWNDEKSIKILKNCKDAIPSRAEGGKVIIIEMVTENQIEDKESIETQLCEDVFTMSVVTGRERNESEWKNLFLAAGFSDYKIISMLGLRSLIEVYP